MADKVKFTPGPWSANSDPMYSKGEPWIIWGPEGPGYGSVADVAPHCPPHPGHGKYEETKANARLIAAAPDMYEALKAMAVKYDFGDKLPSDHPIVKVRAALAKVEGCL